MGGLILVVLISAGAMVWHLQRTAVTNDAWRRAARSLGLSFTPGGFLSDPVMKGIVDDMVVEISAHSERGKEHRSSYTCYKVRHVPVGPRMRLTKQGRFSFLDRMIGRRDILVGDPFFDDRVIVDSRAEGEINAFLTPSRRAAVLHLLSTWPSGEFTEQSVQVSSSGRERDPNRMRSTLRRLIDTAKVMGDATADAALELQQLGELGQAANELHELNQARPNIFTEILEGEALVELGRHEQAAVVFDAVVERLPEDPSLGEWQGLANRLAPPATPTVPPEPGALPERIESPVAADLDQQVVVDDLFAANRMSWEIVEYFESTYEHAAVEWVGTVTQFNTYRHDSDFSGGPGIKATVLLGQAGESDFISNEVHAIVQLPADVPIERGDELRFRGLLAHVDHFSRKIFIHKAVPLS